MESLAVLPKLWSFQFPWAGFGIALHTEYHL